MLIHVCYFATPLATFVETIFGVTQSRNFIKPPFDDIFECIRDIYNVYSRDICTSRYCF